MKQIGRSRFPRKPSWRCSDPEGGHGRSRRRVDRGAAEEPPVRRKSVVREYVEAILVALVLTLLIRTFVIQAFRIPSDSMVPTLLVGDHILVNKFVYRFGAPKRGDIIVFQFPVDEPRLHQALHRGRRADLFIKDQVVYVDGGRRPTAAARSRTRGGSGRTGSASARPRR